MRGFEVGGRRGRRAPIPLRLSLAGVAVLVTTVSLLVAVLVEAVGR